MRSFESAALPLGELTHLLRSKAVLMPGVSVTLSVEKTKEVQTWLYKGGLRDYLSQEANFRVEFLTPDAFIVKLYKTFKQRS